MGRRLLLNTFNIRFYLNYAQTQCVGLNVLGFGRMGECWAFKKRARTLPEHVFHMIAGKPILSDMEKVFFKNFFPNLWKA